MKRATVRIENLKDWDCLPGKRYPKERGYPGCVYAIKCGNNIKIGTASDPKKRIKALQTHSAEPLVLLAYREFMWGHSFEKWFHHKLAEYRVYGEWFELPKEWENKLLAALGENSCQSQVTDELTEYSEAAFVSGWCQPVS